MAGLFESTINENPLFLASSEVNAAAAAQSAEEALASANSAASSATVAQNAANAAQASATSAANDAVTTAASVADAQTAETNAEGWAAAASTSASNAATSATQASNSATTASGYVTTVQASADAAAASASAAATSASNAQTYASNAQGQANTASFYKTQAEQAKIDAEAASDLASLWANQETGEVVAGEGYSAKYWAAQAAGAVAGVATFNGRSGAVTPQAGDYTASQVGAYSTSETYTKSEVDAAIAAGGGGGGGGGGALNTFTYTVPDPVGTGFTVPWEARCGALFANYSNILDLSQFTHNADNMTITWADITAFTGFEPAPGDVITVVPYTATTPGGPSGLTLFEYTATGSESTVNVPFDTLCGMFFVDYAFYADLSPFTHNGTSMTINTGDFGGFPAGAVLTVVAFTPTN